MADTHSTDDSMCQETTGFLFSHACDRFAAQACTRCRKKICNEHTHEGAEGAVCTTCAKKAPPPVGSPVNPLKRADQKSGSSRPYSQDPYYNDPYFYGSSWYPGYGYYGSSYRRPSRASNSAETSGDSGSDFADDGDHDPNDFTEGDAENLRHEGDEAFESEMGES